MNELLIHLIQISMFRDGYGYELKDFGGFKFPGSY